jgi:hypothetical protein
VHALLLTHGKPCPVSDLFGICGRKVLAQARAVADEMQPPARPLALGTHARVGQPNRRNRGVGSDDPVGLCIAGGAVAVQLSSCV